MPWTPKRYPNSLRNLPQTVRVKAIAIAIANALLNEGMDEGRAIRIATAKSETWARHRRRRNRGQ